MTPETHNALQTLKQVLNGAIKAGAFIESTSVVLAHNALVHVEQELERLVTAAAERAITAIADTEESINTKN